MSGSRWHIPVPLFLIIALLAACDGKRIYEENIHIPKYIWNIGNKPTFNVTIADTTQVYNVYVNVRHTRFFPNRNLWVMIKTKFPNGQQLEKRVELELANKDGRWYGDCLGDICDVQVPIQKNAFFEEAGEYVFEMEQIMRVENLPFVMSMGLRIEKAGEKE